jgi:predicted nucleic acid-binding protein
MILYLDTSALVKKYFKEFGSNDVIAKWKEAMGVVTSAVTYAETMASIHRKKREAELPKDIFDRITDSFQNDWAGFFCLEVTNDLNGIIDKLLLQHPLRGFDVIHLSSALFINQNVDEEFLFACFDEKLNHAAKAEGLDTLHS